MLLYISRFLLFATIYCAVVMWWAVREGGHGAMGIIAGGLIVAGGAAAAWLAAVVIGRFVRGGGVRFAVHVLSTVIIFMVLSAAIFSLLAGVSVSPEDAIYQGFTGIVAIAAVADGAVGAWREQARAAPIS